MDSDSESSGYTGTVIISVFVIINLVLLIISIVDASHYKKCERMDYHTFCPNRTCPDGTPSTCQHDQDNTDFKPSS